MRIWPFGKVERRNAYADAVLAMLLNSANGEDIEAAVAAVEVVTGLWGRALASAKVTPETPATAALTPAILASIGRSLMAPGEAVFEIIVEDGELQLQPVGNWSIEGGPSRLSWEYLVMLSGPSGMETRRLTRARVVHVMYSNDPSRPWKGCGPLSRASTTVAMASSLERRLQQEVSMRVGAVLPMPEGQISALQADINALKGNSLLVPSTSSGWDQGTAAAPREDWQPRRLGADPPEALVALRSGAAEHILAACGIPVPLLGRSDGTLLREAWRQFLHASVRPVAEIIAEELAEKLDTPDLAFNFDALQASDVQGRARAFGSLVTAGMAPEQAEIVAGLREV